MTPATHERQFTGWHMLASLIAFFGVVLGVNLTLAYFASSTWSGLVVENGYVASQSFGRDLARARDQEALGWQVRLSHGAERLRVTFADAGRQEISGLAVSGVLRRPVSARHDMPLTFSNAGGGVYSVPVSLAPGLWEVEIEATREGAAPYRKTFRFLVKG